MTEKRICLKCPDFEYDCFCEYSELETLEGMKALYAQLLEKFQDNCEHDFGKRIDGIIECGRCKLEMVCGGLKQIKHCINCPKKLYVRETGECKLGMQTLR